LGAAALWRMMHDEPESSPSGENDNETET